MTSDRIVDRVIGTKRCAKCASPVVVESYTIPGAAEQLNGYVSCPHRFLSETPSEYRMCGCMEFLPPKYEVKMKMRGPFPMHELLRRM